MESKIDLNWLIANGYVRQVDEQVLPVLSKFNYLIDVKIDSTLTVFFYTAEVSNGDLLVVQRESYYLESQDGFVHANKIRVFPQMTAIKFASLITHVVEPTEKSFSLLGKDEQIALTELDVKKNGQ